VRTPHRYLQQIRDSNGRLLRRSSLSQEYVATGIIQRAKMARVVKIAADNASSATQRLVPGQESACHVATQIGHRDF
jgi:hypothetical protein